MSPKHPLNRLATAALVGALIVVLAGCGGSPAGPVASNPEAASSAAIAAPSAAAPSSTEPTPAPPAVATAAPAGQPSLPAIFSSHADPGLEAQLPSAVAGTGLAKYSVTFAEALDAGGDRASIDAFLTSVGKTEADGTFAVALDPTFALGGGVFAFKVNGVDTAALMAGIVSAEGSDLGGGATTSKATIGGKAVTVVSVGTGVNDTEWVYGRGDTVFVVQAGDEAQAAAFLAVLP